MAAYDVFPDEIRRICLGNFGKWFRLDPLSEVVDGDDGEFILPRGFRELADDVHAPLSKGSWNDDAAERGWQRSAGIYRIVLPNRRHLSS